LTLWQRWGRRLTKLLRMNVKAAAVDDFGGLDTPIRYELRCKNIGGKDEDRSLEVVVYLVIMLGLQVLQHCDVDNL
jgi:hypothetical protein